MSFMNKAQSKEIMQELDFESDSSKTEMKKRKRSIQNNKNINDKKKKIEKPSNPLLLNKLTLTLCLP